ncbi:MAG TPA: SAM-dependent methyltransferase [Ferruginibacter sp.]|nr:SAM-dependent methyltransferase [Ferruginibacter sp.]
MKASIEQFLVLAGIAADANELVKITLGGKRGKESDLKNLFVKPVLLKTGKKLSFVYRHDTRDITKNFDTKEALVIIEQHLKKDFYNADLFTTNGDYQLLQHNNGIKITQKPASHKIAATEQHDKLKQRIIQSKGKIYLHQLGVTTAEGSVKKEMQDKYKQINKYVEIIEGIIKDIDFGKNISVADMGSGKGYLTFALYDYLTSSLKLEASVTGIEMRQDLINTCNKIAAASGFTKLHFKKGTIADTSLPTTDMLIALHACDTATDDAIFKGIVANAKVIIVAPCCHKQIRKQMKPVNVLAAITRHGILLERQAEMVTDTIRALLLEANGYKTKVFEFINTEHTPKNVMIVGVQSGSGQNKNEIFDKIKALKSLFNIQEHYLEKLIGSE